MVRWNKADVPHKGWKYIGIEDLGEDVYPGEEIRYEQCEMCGNEKIRNINHIFCVRHIEVLVTSIFFLLIVVYYLRMP